MTTTGEQGLESVTYTPGEHVDAVARLVPRDNVVRVAKLAKEFK